MKISIVAGGKAARNAAIAGRHAMTEPMRKIRSIGPDIEWWDVNEVQIPGTKIGLWRAFLDTLDTTTERNAQE